MAKILVIEDENRMAELLKRGLEESGHTVGTATNVSEGLRMFAYEKQDIIISAAISDGKTKLCLY